MLCDNCRQANYRHQGIYANAKSNVLEMVYCPKCRYSTVKKSSSKRYLTSEKTESEVSHG
jgi:uncharacterized protein (DUF2225 family)